MSIVIGAIRSPRSQARIRSSCRCTFVPSRTSCVCSFAVLASACGTWWTATASLLPGPERPRRLAAREPVVDALLLRAAQLLPELAQVARRRRVDLDRQPQALAQGALERHQPIALGARPVANRRVDDHLPAGGRVEDGDLGPDGRRARDDLHALRRLQPEPLLPRD